MSDKTIREMRRDMNMTQIQIAKLMGISDQTFARWEKGFGQMSGSGRRLFRCLHKEAVEGPFSVSAFLRQYAESP